MSEEEKKFDLQNFNFENFYGPNIAKELKVWTGDEASYYECEKELCSLWTDKFDAILTRERKVMCAAALSSLLVFQVFTPWQQYAPLAWSSM